jgi:phosphoglycolate phosphatase-like HAD superfamily hydrolase
LRNLLESQGIMPPARFDANRDPLKFLSWVHDAHPNLTQVVEDALIVGEETAVESARPTADGGAVIKAAGLAGLQVAIVSNNAGSAIARYLALHGLTSDITAVVGRKYGAPTLMKPHPDALHRALEVLGTDAGASIMIGDTTTDMQASRAAGVRPIGYTKGDGRGPALARAGAEVVVDDMGVIAEALEAL